MFKELLNMVRKLNESYSDIWSDNAWDAYDIALEYLGAEGLCEALARAMGTDALADNLKYIFRTNEIPFDEDDEDDEDFDESCGRKSKKRRGKKSVKEGFHRVDMQDKIRNMERDFGEIKRIVNHNVSGYDDDLYEDFNNAEHALGVLDRKLVEKYDPDRY
jgi:hypothetical protein